LIAVEILIVWNLAVRRGQLQSWGLALNFLFLSFRRNKQLRQSKEETNFTAAQGGPREY
jgi:hypothetical protein